MPENECKPVVIDLTDGKMRDLPFVFEGKRVGIYVKAETHTTDRVALAIWELPFNRRIGEAWFKPDPVRAAELAERERIRTALKATMVFGGVPSAVLCCAIDVGIDAPAKPVSEGERGAEDMRLRAAREATAQACYEVAAAIKALPLTEPL